MPIWGWILSAIPALAGLAALLLALFHVRYRAAWRGEWDGLESRHEGAVRLEFGFPGFMRAWEWPAPPRSPAEMAGMAGTEAPAPTPAPEGGDGRGEAAEIPFALAGAGLPGIPRAAGTGMLHVRNEARAAGLTPDRPEGRRARTRNRLRRALFRLATDAAAWSLLLRYGGRALRRAHRLLRPRFALTAGHPDPALLGRVAGYWSAAAPLLPAGGATLGFRFQDRRPSLGVRAEGGFSALSLLRFGAGLLWTFPWLGLARRAWRGWRGHRLSGWRAWTYRRLQAR